MKKRYVIFYCNSGNLPKEKAEGYVSTYTKMLQTEFGDGIKVLGIPIRGEQSTRLELFEF